MEHQQQDPPDWKQKIDAAVNECVAAGAGHSHYEGDLDVWYTPDFSDFDVVEGFPPAGVKYAHYDSYHDVWYRPRADRGLWLTVPPRPRRTPRRRGAGRPAIRRRAGASSRTASADPGDDGPGEPSASRCAADRNAVAR